MRAESDEGHEARGGGSRGPTEPGPCAQRPRGCGGGGTQGSARRVRQQLTAAPPPLGPEEEQEASGDLGSGGAALLLDDLEDARERGPKDRLRELREPSRAVTDDEDDEDREDEAGHLW